VDDVCWVQRFSPRRSTSRLSDMNRERVRRLVAARRMTPAGLARIKHVFDPRTDRRERAKWTVPKDILRRLKRDPTIWRNFSRFPESYRRIRIGWIIGARKRADVFEQRLTHFLEMTAKNKRFGMVQ
jgi:uncharacterized protein YdeI (YjbR/CyaY-like superfamily)